jgi:peptidoglycan hydrolase-like protein with peptidoglycan-binding domain
MQPHRRRAGLVAAAVVSMTLAACVDVATTAAATLPPATVAVVRTDLRETRTEAGTLGYGESWPIAVHGTGTITRLPRPGSVVAAGEALFHVDERPVVALAGAVPMYRPLRVDAEAPSSGADVRQLQENLTALGYELHAEEGYGPATAEAVRAWQADVGVPVTGAVEVGQVVFVPGPVRVSELLARPGDPVRGSPIMNVTGTARVVSVPLRVGDLTLVDVGRRVPVRVSGRGEGLGRIASVGTVVRNGTVEVTVAVDDDHALGDLSAAPVEVEFVSQTRQGVLVVPVSALLALPAGGYGVEVVSGETTRIVPVRTGMFAGGRVEIDGPDIVEGVRVGVPR